MAPARQHPLSLPALPQSRKRAHLMLRLTALIAALGATALPATVLATCAGVSDCSHYAVDVLIDLDHQQAILWSKAATVQQCQDACHAKETSYYRFKQGPGRRQGVCSCFNDCSSLTTGEATTGLVSKCKTSSLIKLHLQQAQGLREDWSSLEPEDSTESSQSRRAGLARAATADGTDTSGNSVSGFGDVGGSKNSDDLVWRLEGQERLMQEQEQQQQGLMRVQQQKQLQNYRSMELPGWRVLHEKHQLLERRQVLFLQQQELYRRERTQGRKTRVAQS